MVNAVGLGKPVGGLSCLILFLCLATTASSAGYEEARVAYGKKNYTEARSQCEPLGETDPKCQNLLAAMHFNGLGVKKNPTRARAYWEKSVEGGFYKAYGNLARQLYLGRGVNADADRAGKLADKAYELAKQEGDKGYIKVISRWMIRFHRTVKTGDTSLVGKWTARLKEAQKTK